MTQSDAYYEKLTIDWDVMHDLLREMECRLGETKDNGEFGRALLDKAFAIAMKTGDRECFDDIVDTIMRQGMDLAQTTTMH
jgi:hypothetical protein